eukprot:scaffold11547_cov51-Attheya_sp.AAC.1
MVEGFSEGCPLSSIFAALVLHGVLHQLKQEHDTNRTGSARTRGSGRPEMSPIAFMDDTNVLLDPADVNWFLKRIATLGMPVGIIIGKKKTKILTNTNGVSIIPFLSASVGASLSEAIKNFTAGEATRGLRVLGIPLGSIPFQREYITKFTKNLITDTTTMCQVLPDPQTVAQIYQQCLIARVPFQLTADILSTVDPDNLPDNNL